MYIETGTFAGRTSTIDRRHKGAGRERGVGDCKNITTNLTMGENGQKNKEKREQ